MQTWMNLNLSTTVPLALPSVICREVLSKHISWNSMKDNEFFTAHAHLIQISLLSFFYFVKTEPVIHKENHMRPEGWLCYTIEALLQSVHGYQCWQITDRKHKREGGNKRKETQQDAIKAYHKSCHHHWELLICSNCHGWLHFETIVCHQKKWNAFGFLVIPNTLMWEND